MPNTSSAIRMAGNESWMSGMRMMNAALSVPPERKPGAGERVRLARPAEALHQVERGGIECVLQRDPRRQQRAEQQDENHYRRNDRDRRVTEAPGDVRIPRAPELCAEAFPWLGGRAHQRAGAAVVPRSRGSSAK